MKTLFNSPNYHELSQGSHSRSKGMTVAIWSILLLMVVSTASAQQPGRLPEVTITGTNTHVNQKVLKAFSRSFKDAESPRWYQLGRKYLVKYNMNDMLHKALFRNKGGFIYDIGYGLEKDLPVALRNQVKGNYKDFDITTAVVVTQSSRNLWKINVEDADSIILLHAENGLLVEEDRIDKASGSTAAYSMTQSLNRLLSDF